MEELVCCATDSRALILSVNNEFDSLCNWFQDWEQKKKNNPQNIPELMKSKNDHLALFMI